MRIGADSEKDSCSIQGFVVLPYVEDLGRSNFKLWIGHLSVVAFISVGCAIRTQPRSPLGYLGMYVRRVTLMGSYYVLSNATISLKTCVFGQLSSGHVEHTFRKSDEKRMRGRGHNTIIDNSCVLTVQRNSRIYEQEGDEPH